MMTIDDLAKYSSVSQSTIKRKYRTIPGILKEETGFIIPDGTRYPFDVHRYGFKDMGTRYAALLDATSKNRYIDNEVLCIDEYSFRSMISDLLKVGYLCENGTGNMLGANRFNTTFKYEQIKKERANKRTQTIINNLSQIGAALISFAAGNGMIAAI